jgi:hypothetical protein
MALDETNLNRRTLEDAFFLKEDAKIIARLQELRKLQESKEALSKVSGIQNDDVLQKLIDLDIRPETVVSLSLVPLVEVAWVDGKVTEKEKQAVLAATGKLGWAKGTPDYDLLERWLTHRPDPKLLEAWSHYVRDLCSRLNEQEKKNLKTFLLDQARTVAGASGGILGLGNKISKAEEAMLDKLAAAFDIGT